MKKKLKSDSPLDAATCSPSSLTPETDAMIATDQHHLEDDNFFPATVYWRMCDVARTLERERDELLDAIRNLRDVEGRHHSEIATKRLFALLPENAEQSRDDGKNLTP